MGLNEGLAAALETARRTTTDLLAPLDDDDLVRQHSPLMSPLVWDMAHVGNYEDLWLLRAVGKPGVGPEYDDMYDAFRHPRPNRPSLPLLAPDAARQYIGDVRHRVLDVLADVDLSPDCLEPLLQKGFVYSMVLQHEHQHIETMWATLQLRDAVYEPAPTRPAPVVDDGPAEVLVPGGPFRMGCGWSSAYDNEKPEHQADLPAYWIDRVPVSVGQYQAFVDEGGYHRPELWSDEGWKWRMAEGLEAPLYWGPDGTVRHFGRWVERNPAEPVQHVCFYEAEAYARFVGRRLPTEAEWEKASHDHLQGMGRVWEWTSSSFGPYPGFASFPYREYSEVFFGDDYKVLRGFSWATGGPCQRQSFRNWDYPIRRQIFSGFRCAGCGGLGPVCRLLGYVGPPVALDALLLDPPHSLLRQSWAPREQVHGVVNADGFGVGWYDPAVRPEPAVYRSARPMWADRNLPSMAPMIRTGAFLAAVRSATPPSPSEETGAPPFTEGRWLFAHNGAVESFWGDRAAGLRRQLSDRRLAGLEGATDAEVLFKLALDRIDGGLPAADALRSLVDEVPGRLNLMLHDGAQVTATASGESLYVRAGVLASEPFDDDEGWERLPDRSVVVATAETVKVEPL